MEINALISNPVKSIVDNISHLIDNKLDKYKTYVINAIKYYRIGSDQLKGRGSSIKNGK